MKTIAVVQARMASNRLPGKVMKIIGSRRAIGWCVNAAMNTPGVDAVVVATSVNPENDVIEGWCHTSGVRCYRGSEDDVLDRYCGLIRHYDAGRVVRITADCPFLDSHVLGDLLAMHQATGAVYATNQWPPTWPDGLDCEVVTAQALLEAGEEATSQTDRDTVTQFIWRNQSRWPAVNLTCPLPLEQERWVLDSPQDLELLRHIAQAFPDDWKPCWHDIWHYLNENPALRDINTQWSRNQRFYEALGDESYQKSFDRTKKDLERASKVIPCASQTFSKSCKSLPSEGAPLFASHGNGCYIFDVDGNRYIDMVGALLPVILGYNDPDVDYAIRRQLDKGISLSLATELEAELAEILVDLIPCAEMVRFGKNGSDATSGAVRLARAYTGRDRVAIIQEGEGYHGWHDWAIANTPRDTGVPGIVKGLTHRMAPCIDTIKEKMCRHKYAAVIIDPENHEPAFLSQLGSLCNSTGAVYIFDEIRTGFRYHLGGYQKYTGVIPHLACFGKAMANGMPISAICGPKHIMNSLNHAQGPFWSGTYFGETLSLAAAIATIKKLKYLDAPTHFWTMGTQLMDGIKPLIGDMDGLAITGQPQRPVISAYCKGKQQSLMRQMVKEGVLLINSLNTNLAMGPSVIEQTVSAFKKVLQ